MIYIDYDTAGIEQESWVMYNGDEDKTGFIAALNGIIRNGNY